MVLNQKSIYFTQVIVDVHVFQIKTHKAIALIYIKMCGGNDYIEMTFYEVCKKCSFTSEQIENRMWVSCTHCQGIGSIKKIIKQRCPACLFYNNQNNQFQKFT